MEPGKTITGCTYIGEYVDEGPVPPGAVFGGEVVRPIKVVSFVDVWRADEGITDFTVLLKDNRSVVVAGHGLKLFQSTHASEDSSYGIVVRAGQEENIVALFKMTEVLGIFRGEVHPSRKIA